MSKENGTYITSGFVPGTYHLLAHSDLEQPLVNEWWSSLSSQRECAQSQAVTVTNADILDTNFQLGGCNLQDVIIHLQVLSDMEPQSTIQMKCDLNRDGKIRMDETLYILQDAAGMW